MLSDIESYVVGVINYPVEERNSIYLKFCESIFNFEDRQNYWDKLNKNEKEKNITQDNLADRQIFKHNDNKDENENNFYDNEFNDDNEIIELESYINFISNYNHKADPFSPKLYLDLSIDYNSLLFGRKPKNDFVKENSNLNDEEYYQIYKNPVINDKSILRERDKKNIIHYRRYIKGVNNKFSNSDNYYIKLMNPIFLNFIDLKENKVYCYMMNGKFFNSNGTQGKDLNSQNSFSDIPNNNEASLPNDSQNDSFSDNDDLKDNLDQFNDSQDDSPPDNDDCEDNSYQSNSLSSRLTSLDQNTMQSNCGLSFLRKLLNKKRKRSKNKAKNILKHLPNQNIFKTVTTNDRGRKKKNSNKKGKHTRDSPDNMRSKIKTYSLKFLYYYFNEKIKEIGINDLDRLYQIRRVNKKTKVYFLDLLNQSLKSIFSSPISRKSDKIETYNKNLIDKIYTINEEGNSEKTKKIIKFFDMRYEEFFDIIKKIKDEEKSQENIDGIDDDFKDMAKKFDYYLEKKLSKDSKDKAYKQKFKNLMKNFPSNIRNMKEKKNKN